MLYRAALQPQEVQELDKDLYSFQPGSEVSGQGPADPGPGGLWGTNDWAWCALLTMPGR